MTAERTLLADYVATGSERAFAELVGRYIHLVYATAMRLVNGDTHRAEDVAQTVFADLARLAGTLSEEVMLGGWLHRRTCHVAADLMRRERRRQNRERQAAEMNALNDHPDSPFTQIAPFLDEAINQLGSQDRAAIVLRFFEGGDLRTVGAVLGSNEDAAQKRVTRALEKLRILLRRRGANASGAVLASVLATEAVTAAPAGLAAGVASMALAGAGTGAGITLPLLKLMALTKLKVAVGGVVVAGVVTTAVIQHQTQAALRTENEALRARISQSSAGDWPQTFSETSGRENTAASQLEELLRLRREVASLREQKQSRDKRLRDAVRSRWQPASNGVSLSPHERWPNVIRDLPRELWTYAGYADPDAAFQSFLWASSNKDADALLNSFVPEARAEAPTEALKEKMLQIIGGNMSRWQRVQVLEKQNPTNDEVHFIVDIVYKDGRDSIIKLKLKRVGNEWKYAGEGPVE